MRKVYKFKNGASLIYRKNRLSRATAIRFGINRGGALDNNTGLSHLLEHMLFKGTSTKTKEQLDEDIRLNISSINASTGAETLVMRFYESSKQFEKGLEICADCFLNANFPEEELEKEKQVVLQEIIRDKDNQARIAFKNLWNTAYNYPETKSSTLGDENKMLKITRKNLLNYKQNNFISNNFYACVTSSLPFLKVKKLIKKYLVDNLKMGDKPDFNIYDFKINGDSKLVCETMDRNKVKILIGFPTCGFLELEQNFIDGLSIKYLNVMKSPMWNQFREKHQLVYAISMGRSTNRNDGLIFFDIETEPKKVNMCFDVLGELFKEIKNEVNEKDVNRVKRNFKEFRDRYVGHPTDYCIDDFYEYLGHGRLLKEREFKFEKKDITLDNVKKSINNLVNFDKVFVSVVGNIKKEDIYSIKKIKSILKANN